MISHCPTCGRPLAVLEQMLAEHSPNYQCHHCWNRIHATGAVTPLLETPRPRKPRILSARRTVKTLGRKT